MADIKQHYRDLSTAIADRDFARDDLFQQLMAMPPDERVKVSPALFARLTQAQLLNLLGGDGNPIDRTTVPSSHSGSPKPLSKRSRPKAVRIRAPFLSAFASGLSVTAVAGAMVIIGVVFGPKITPAFAQPPTRSIDAAQWPSCPRIDGDTDGCVYQVQSGLTWDEAAALLRMPEALLRASNQSTQTLSPGTQIIIWRGLGTLTH